MIDFGDKIHFHCQSIKTKQNKNESNPLNGPNSIKTMSEQKKVVKFHNNLYENCSYQNTFVTSSKKKNKKKQ